MVSEQGEAIGGYPCHPPSHLPVPPGVGRRQGPGRFGGLGVCRIPSPPSQVAPSPSGRPGLRSFTQEAGPPVLLLEEPWPACPRPPAPGLPPQPGTPQGEDKLSWAGDGLQWVPPRRLLGGCAAGSRFPGNVRGGLQGCEGGADVPAVSQSPQREGLGPTQPGLPPAVALRLSCCCPECPAALGSGEVGEGVLTAPGLEEQGGSGHPEPLGQQSAPSHGPGLPPTLTPFPCRVIASLGSPGSE